MGDGANLFTEISGATSVEILATDLRTAATDPAIDQIVLEIDSPGGEATGIAELAGQIREISDTTKPVIAYVDGMAASAAYWLAAAATEIVTSPTAMLGSIGVVATYRREKSDDIKIISSLSPLKQASPETEAGRAEVQRLIDQLAEVFVADVSTYRDAPEERVRAEFGQGGLLIASDAVNVGMADTIGSFETLLQPAGAAGPKQPRGARMTYQIQVNEALGLPAEASADEAISSIEAIMAENTQASADQASALAQAKTDATQAERERVAAIVAAVADAPHARAIADVAIAQGLPVDTATAMIDAAPSTDNHLALARSAYQAEAQAPAPTADGGEPQEPHDFESHVAAEMRQGKSRGQAIRTVAAASPDLHRAYLARLNQAS